MPRDLLARQALANIPRMLTLLDRNAHSPTFGCFDRNYWHYKILDFPSGMSQEFVWPLALVHELDLPGNPYYRQPVVRDWVRAGIAFAGKASHRDGSCDDYFPFERATGAAAFSLLACVESYRLLGLDDPGALRFFERRADWLASHEESGRLTNHHALVVLSLALLSRLLNTDRWDAAMDRRLAQVLSWQSEEGWFQEYDGYDPGYDTLTISCLAWLLELTPDNTGLRRAIEAAVKVAATSIHPDGSFGGEYGSRNTYNYFPHGFELAGRWLPEALSINDRFLSGALHSQLPSYEDDHLVGHHTWNYLLAWRDYVAERPPLEDRSPGRVHFGQAGLLVDRRDGTELYLSLAKGGVFKLFRDGRLVVSDTQVSLQVRSGRRLRTAVANLPAESKATVSADEILIQGRLGWAKQPQMTPAKLVLLRAVMLSFGRWFPNLIRRLLQRMIITGTGRSPFLFSRRLHWKDGRWHVEDEVRAPDWTAVGAVGLGCDQTSVYGVMSRIFHLSQLVPWLDLTAQVRGLRPGEQLRVERKP